MTAAERAGVAVFAKAPVAGEVKTRLAARLGPREAACLHSLLVRRAVSTAVASGLGPVEIWCAPDESHELFRRCAAEHRVALRRQPGGDLGARMAAAFAVAHARGDALLAIGSDCPALDAGLIREASAALATHDAVVIPAEDGGYVLLGLARPSPGLFEGIAWGGGEVMAETRERLRASGSRWIELETLWDVDRPEDYDRLVREGLLEEVRA
ncbi:MAG TPA: TIGR04282 family arsenosugar biosynthesis glycosyltransferase [Usitatibacter sp.]|nr:TIGR04282 family arsenosugar biosynthesis glycosyltransferase [Usitatibacter sp.]